jgi:hypothetical protein
MTSSQQNRQSSGFMEVAGLFIPWTLPPWLILFSGLFVAWSNSVPYPFAVIPLAPGFFLFFAAFLVGVTTSTDLWVRTGAALACFVGNFMFFYSFSNLLAGGQGVHAGQIQPQDVPVSLLTMSFLVAVWLVVGVPDQAHKVGLKKDGYAQRILVRVMTAGACVSLGIYFFAEHLHGGPLRDVHTGLLVVGIVFGAVLLAPIFSAIERAIWRRGLSSVFSAKTLTDPWRKMTAEVLDALYHPAQHETTPGSEEAVEAETTEKHATTPAAGANRQSRHDQPRHGAPGPGHGWERWRRARAAARPDRAG